MRQPRRAVYVCSVLLQVSAFGKVHEVSSHARVPHYDTSGLLILKGMTEGSKVQQIKASSPKLIIPAPCPSLARAERAIAAGIAVTMSAENTPALAHRLRRMLNKRKTPDAATGTTENNAAVPGAPTDAPEDTSEGAAHPNTEATGTAVPPTGPPATSDSPTRTARRVSATEVMQIE